MSMDRSWLRRPLVSPPPFGVSVPDIWAETVLTFVNREPKANAIGGFAGSGEREYGPVRASVTISPDSGFRTEAPATGPQRRRTYIGIVAVAQMATIAPYQPRKGDLMRFTDPKGTAISIEIYSADLPEALSDHWEIESEDIE